MIETERLRIRNFVSEDSKSCFESWGKDKDLGNFSRADVDIMHKMIINRIERYIIKEEIV